MTATRPNEVLASLREKIPKRLSEKKLFPVAARRTQKAVIEPADIVELTDCAGMVVRKRDLRIFGC